jgi:hypothetical protein
LNRKRLQRPNGNSDNNGTYLVNHHCGSGYVLEYYGFKTIISSSVRCNLLGIAIAIVIWQGFTQQAFEFVGILALALFITWARFSKSIADTTRARNFLENNLSRKNYDTCKICGKKLSFHRKPKNLSQLLSGGLTCENCGAEFNVPFDAFFPR